MSKLDWIPNIFTTQYIHKVFKFDILENKKIEKNKKETVDEFIKRVKRLMIVECALFNLT